MIPPAADLLKFGHHEFTFRSWLMVLSHLRMKAKFSAFFDITCRASLSILYWKVLFSQTLCAFEKLHNFKNIFVEKYFKFFFFTKIYSLRFVVFLCFPLNVHINVYFFLILFHFLSLLSTNSLMIFWQQLWNNKDSIQEESISYSHFHQKLWIHKFNL